MYYYTLSIYLCLTPIDFYVKSAGGYCLHFSRHSAIDTQITKSAAHQTTSEGDKFGRLLQLLGARRDACEKTECFILHHVHAVVVGAQVIHLLLVNQCPEVSANKFHGLQLILEAADVSREALDQPIAGGKAYVLQGAQIILILQNSNVYTWFIYDLMLHLAII